MTDISNCCGASINVHRGGEGTNYYICWGCGKPCDPATPSNRIRHLEKENAWLKAERDAYHERLQEKRVEVVELKSALKMAGEALAEYGSHDKECILAQYQGGRPTEDGGYETCFGYGKEQKWYREENLPACQCGFTEALSNPVLKRLMAEDGR